MKIIFEQVMLPDEVRTEDGGCAKIWYCDRHVDGPDGDEVISKVFVRFQSWDEDNWAERDEAGKPQEHKLFDSLIGKRVRITIESLDVLDRLADLD